MTQAHTLRHALTLTALTTAWEKVAHNQGMAGLDQQSIEQYQVHTANRLRQLAQKVITGHYQPTPLLRVWVERPGKKPRGLAVPSVEDRILQTSIALTITPLIESRLEACSYAYRQGRGVRQAVQRIQQLQNQGYRWIVDADIESFFDNIPHAPLLQKLAALHIDAAILRLIQTWLTTPIQEGQRQYTPHKGIAQGSPISPLLANFYLDSLDDALLDADLALVRYADDFIVLTRTREQAEEALELSQEILHRLSLRLNPLKTRIVHLDQGLEFLGWHFVRSLAIPKQPDGNTSLTQVSIDWPQAPPQPPMAHALQEALLAAQAEDPDWRPAQPSPTTQPATHADTIQGAEPIESTHPLDELPPLAPLQRTLYLLNPKSQLNVSNQRYTIREADKTLLEIPPHVVDQIMVFGPINISTQAIQLAARHQCSIALLGRFGKYYGRFEPSQGQHTSLWLEQASHHPATPFAIQLVRKLIEAKIHNSIVILNRYQRHHPHTGIPALVTRLREMHNSLAKQDNIDSLRGVEGAAAAQYWQAFSLLLPPQYTFTGRQKNPAPDMVNALLSLGYHILYHSVGGLLQARGLNAHLGWLHVAGGEHLALASDIMESYRAYTVDATVLNYLHRHQPSPQYGTTQDGKYLLHTETSRQFIRQLEHRFGQAQKRPGTQEIHDLRRIIDRDILSLTQALRHKDPHHFTPTLWH